MGNDEFILYMRKNNLGSKITNPEIGKRIWQWLESKDAIIVVENKPCYWGKRGAFINDLGLPKTAAQFEFDRAFLPELYNYLDTIA